MSSQDNVWCCPVCGMLYAQHCWHEGREVMSVQMTREQALKLLKNTEAGIEEELKHVRTHIEIVSKYIS